MKLVSIYKLLIGWFRAKLSNSQFLILSSILVGITAGLAAVTLKTLVHYIYFIITRDYDFPYQYYAYLLFPLIGILMTVYITKHLFQGRLGRGTANILRAIIKKSAFLPLRQTYSHIITSAITVGFGGSAGLESPIVTTGSAIGSNYAKAHHLSYKERVLLLACGAAAGIAGVFNSPIAGVLFALEVLLVDATISAFIPLIIAAAVGALCSKIILKEGMLLSFDLQESFDYQNTLSYLFLGLLAGMLSVYYARIFTWIEQIFSFPRLTGYRRLSRYKKAIIGGLILAVLILFFPPLFGEGYSSIKALAEQSPERLLKNSILSSFADNQWFVLFFVGIVMLMKIVSASVTIGSGGNGGHFAPSLFVGAYLGFFFSRTINILGIAHLPESNFTIVAMAGVLTGVFYAPLTGIFLIAEITRGYDLMIPLMIVSATSYVTVKYFEPLSMDAKKLAKNGHVITQDKDKTILSSLNLVNIIETDFQRISPDATLGDLVKLVTHSHRNIFPVISENDRLVGIISLDNIRETMFKADLYQSVSVKQLMCEPPAIVSLEENMHSVMQKFDTTGVWNLPVTQDNQYLGIISKSSLLTKYRNQLVETCT